MGCGASASRPYAAKQRAAEQSTTVDGCPGSPTADVDVGAQARTGVTGSAEQSTEPVPGEPAPPLLGTSYPTPPLPPYAGRSPSSGSKAATRKEVIAGLYKTASNGNTDEMARLLQHRENPATWQLLLMAGDRKTKQCPIHMAAKYGHAECARLLLRAVPSPGEMLGVRSSNGWTPLHMAAVEGQAEVTRVLLDAATDPQALLLVGESHFERTPLHYAAARGQADTVRALLQACSSHTEPLLLAKDASGDTPLHDAARMGNLETVELLLGSTPKPEVILMAQNYDLDTPLHWATRRGMEQIARVLLTIAPLAMRLLMLSTPNGAGNTPLEDAAQQPAVQEVFAEFRGDLGEEHSRHEATVG